MSRRIATERVWRTESGRHVGDGDLEAAFLVAAEGDEVPDEVIVDPAVEAIPKLADPAPVEDAPADVADDAGPADEVEPVKPKRASKASAEA